MNTIEVLVGQKFSSSRLQNTWNERWLNVIQKIRPINNNKKQTKQQQQKQTTHSYSVFHHLQCVDTSKSFRKSTRAAEGGINWTSLILTSHTNTKLYTLDRCKHFQHLYEFFRQKYFTGVIHKVKNSPVLCRWFPKRGARNYCRRSKAGFLY